MTNRTPAERIFQALSLVVPYLFPLLTLAVLVAIPVLAFEASLWWVVLVARVVFGAGAVAFGWAVIAAIRYPPEPSTGIPLTREMHPELWHQIDDVAATIGTPPPGRVVITAGPDATVAQVGRGTEAIAELEIGLPLLVRYSIAELRAVLGHELGHIAGGDTAALARVAAPAPFSTTISRQANPLIGWYFAAYRLAFGLLDAAAQRAQEERADRAAVAVAPVDAAISALRPGELIGVWLGYYPEAMVKIDLARRRAPLLDGLALAADAFADDAREWAAAVEADQGAGCSTATHRSPRGPPRTSDSGRSQPRPTRPRQAGDDPGRPRLAGRERARVAWCRSSSDILGGRG